MRRRWRARGKRRRDEGRHRRAPREETLRRRPRETRRRLRVMNHLDARGDARRLDIKPRRGRRDIRREASNASVYALYSYRGKRWRSFFRASTVRSDRVLSTSFVSFTPSVRRSQLLSFRSRLAREHLLRALHEGVFLELGASDHPDLFRNATSSSFGVCRGSRRRPPCASYGSQLRSPRGRSLRLTLLRGSRGRHRRRSHRRTLHEGSHRRRSGGKRSARDGRGRGIIGRDRLGHHRGSDVHARVEARRMAFAA